MRGIKNDLATPDIMEESIKHHPPERQPHVRPSPLVLKSFVNTHGKKRDPGGGAECLNSEIVTYVDSLKTGLIGNHVPSRNSHNMRRGPDRRSNEGIKPVTENSYRFDEPMKI